MATILETAAGAGALNTLLAAVDAAGLRGALEGPGPFTVFAPVDDAFAALPPGTVQTLVDNPPQLARILKYHVLAGPMPALSWWLSPSGTASRARRSRSAAVSRSR